ncbi:MAG: hypothetical protein ACYCVD_03195 [Desulfitobacteriaceae bacterium]
MSSTIIGKAGGVMVVLYLLPVAVLIGVMFVTVKRWLVEDKQKMIDKYSGTNVLLNIYFIKDSSVGYKVIVGCKIKQKTDNKLIVSIPEDSIYHLGAHLDQGINIKEIKRLSLYEPAEYYDFPHRLD